MRMRSLHVPTLLVAALATLSACGDDRGGVMAPPAAPTAIISDGSRTGGNPNFFFLPPLVASPVSDEDYDAGAFVGTWKPVVKVCRLTAALECELEAGQPKYLRTFQGAEVQVSSAEELYKIEWSTRESWATAGTYRASVFLEGHAPLLLGFIDVALLPDQQAVRNLRTGDIVPLLDGRTVPLKFRIESGAAVSPTTVDYVEAVVTDAGGVVTTGQGGAGVFLGEGWLPDGVESVVVTVQRVAPAGAPSSPNDCHGLGVNLSWLKQYEGCYRVETFPAIGVIQANSVFGVCTESPLVESQVMYKSDPLPNGGRRVKALENVPLPLALEEALNCDGFTGLAAAPRARGLRGLMADGAMRMLAGIGRAISPKSAYAIDFGAGGQLLAGVDDFSDFGWAVPVVVGEGTGNGQTIAGGGALAQPISVRTLAAHNHHDDPVYIDGVPVTFTVSGGSLGGPAAVVGAVTVASDANGLATAPVWTLPATPGTYTLVATIPDDSSNNVGAVPQHRSVTFTATVTAPPVVGVSNITMQLPDGSAYDRFSVNTIVGVGTALVAVPRSASGAPVDVACSWSDLQSAAVDIALTDDANTAGIVGVTPTGTTMAQLSVTCGSVSRTILASVAEGDAPGSVDAIEVSFATGAPFDFDEALTENSQYSLVAQPLDRQSEPNLLPETVACGWFWFNSALAVSPFTGRNVTLTTTTGSSRLFVTCQGFTREFNPVIWPYIGE